ncbi:MAG: peroxiredoxin [Pseudomonadota bacterium]
MTIAKGDRLPDHDFLTMTADGPGQVSVADFCDGRTVVIFAVPGAFTPTCHQNHLPGFLEHADAMNEKGVDAIAVVATNDVFVMNAWAEKTGGKGKLTYLTDANAEFAKAIGMDLDLGPMGMRTKRYSMLLKDREVVELNLEDSPGEADKSGAATLLGQL